MDWGLFSFPAQSCGSVRSSHFWWLHTRDHLCKTASGQAASASAVPIPADGFSQQSKKADHRTSQSEAETCLYKSQEQILSGHSSYPLAALQTQRERHAIQLHFPPTRAEFILKKTTLSSLRGEDNKWPRLRRSRYHRLWSLAGFAVETVYFLSFVRGPGVSKKQPNHNRKRNERENTGSFFRKWRGEIKTIKLGSRMEHLWERQPRCETT